LTIYEKTVQYLTHSQKRQKEGIKMKELFVAEVNGQKLTTTRFGKFASLSGRQATYIRKELNRILNTEFVPASRLISADKLQYIDIDAYDAPRIKEHKKLVAKANARLAEITQISDNQIVWESATWHHTYEQAEKAARKVGGIVVPVERVVA
jgi:hypothetical protein